jgi:acylphosphatase
MTAEVLLLTSQTLGTSQKRFFQLCMIAPQLALSAPTLQHWQRLQIMVLHFQIQGRVQGVGFRWFVHREASELELRGWVRNTEDGDVEVVAAGEPADLDELRASLKRGPRGSRVDRIIEHVLDEREAETLGSFQIEGAW